MADIPNQPVIRRIKDIMQRHGQFDHTKTGAQMAARHRDGVNHFSAQFMLPIGANHPYPADANQPGA